MGVTAAGGPGAHPRDSRPRRGDPHCARERRRDDDVVLIAGKGHEDYQIVGAERRPFSDAAVARAALARARGSA